MFARIQYDAIYRPVQNLWICIAWKVSWFANMHQTKVKSFHESCALSNMLEEYTRKDLWRRSCLNDLQNNLSKSYYVMRFPKRFESHESIQYINASITRGKNWLCQNDLLRHISLTYTLTCIIIIIKKVILNHDNWND